MAAAANGPSPSLKVMRLTRPTLRSTALPEHCLNPDEEAVFSGGEQLDYLVLPQTFGTVFMGELFSCYVSVHNDLQVAFGAVKLQVDLQTSSSQRRTLFSEPDPVSLQPGSRIDHIVRHQVSDLGNHVLVCTVSFSDNDQPTSFRKYFRFQVESPLKIETKFHTGNPGDYTLEAVVHNSTPQLVVMETITFLNMDLYSAQANTSPEVVTDLMGDLAALVDAASDSHLLPDSSRSYLFAIKMKSHVALSGAAPPPAVGRLLVKWRSQLGEPGCLETGSLQIPNVAVRSDVLVSLTGPSEASTETEVALSCVVENLTDQDSTLTVQLSDTPGNPLMWAGALLMSDLSCPAQSSVSIPLACFALRSGLHTLNSPQIVFHSKGAARLFKPDISKSICFHPRQSAVTRLTD